MKRIDKYPDTNTFKYYNANPHNHLSGDCVIRAICTATGQTWEETLTGLFNVGIKYGYVPTDDHAIEKYLHSIGWEKMKQPRKIDGRKYTGREFCEWLNCYSGINRSPLICNIGCGHIVCIKETEGDYKVHDIWNSTGGCIGAYYRKVG